MRRKVSIVLILAMVVSMFSSLVYADKGKASLALDDLAVHRFINEVKEGVNKLRLVDLARLKGAVAKINNKDKIVVGILDIIEESAFAPKLREDYGINAGSRQLIIDTVKDAKDQVQIIPFIIEILLGEDFNNSRKLADVEIDSNSRKTMGQLADEIQEELLKDTAIKAVYERLEPANGKSKAAISVEIAELIIKNTTMSLNAPYTITLGETTILNGINNILSDNFNITTRFEQKDIRGLKALIEDVMGDLENTEKLALARAITAIKGGNPYPSTGGGGIIIPPEEPEEPEEPKEPEEPEKPQIEEEEAYEKAIETKQGKDGQAVVTVKEDYMMVVIESLLNAIKEDTSLVPQLKIKLDDVKTLSMDLSIPINIVAKLVENKIELIIESKALTYIIPAGALENAAKDAPQGSSIALISSEVEKTKAQALIKDEFAKNVVKTVKLQLVLKDNDDKIIKVLNKFDTKIKVAIEIEAHDGNPDLLGIFYIDEQTGELEFVGGKIKGNKIYMTIDHYSMYAVIEYDRTFSDIENHWSKDYVKSMAAKHVIEGFGDNSYRPAEQVTRAQFAKLLVEALELEPATYKGEFTDLGPTHWAKDYIATAKQGGIIEGYGDGTFRPDQSITRSEMATMLTNALKLNRNSDPAGLNKFKDAQDVPAWAVEYMVPVVAEELLVGSNGILNPLGNVTRAEAATITYRVYNR